MKRQEFTTAWGAMSRGPCYDGPRSEPAEVDAAKTGPHGGLSLGARRALHPRARYTRLPEVVARRHSRSGRRALLLLRVRAVADPPLLDRACRSAPGSQPHVPAHGIRRPRAARGCGVTDQE